MRVIAQDILDIRNPHFHQVWMPICAYSNSEPIFEFLRNAVRVCVSVIIFEWCYFYEYDTVDLETTAE